MPNRNANAIEINCSIEKLIIDGWLIKSQTGYIFNLHKLFPEVFLEWDNEYFSAVYPPGYTSVGDDTGWYRWNIENLGTKWNPVFDYNECSEEGNTILVGQSARAPPNELLRKFCELSGYFVSNEYEEPGVGFEGTYTYNADGEMDDTREYVDYCETCGKKDESVKCRDNDEYLCDKCYNLIMK